MGTNTNTKTKHVGRGGPRRGSGRPARTVVFRVFPRPPFDGPVSWADRLAATVRKSGIEFTATPIGDTAKASAMDLEVDHRKAVALFAVLQAVDATAKRVDVVGARRAAKLHAGA